MKCLRICSTLAAELIFIHCDLLGSGRLFEVLSVIVLIHEIGKHIVVHLLQFVALNAFFTGFTAYHWHQSGHQQIFLFQKRVLVEMFPTDSLLGVNGQHCLNQFLHLLRNLAVFEC